MIYTAHHSAKRIIVTRTLTGVVVNSVPCLMFCPESLVVGCGRSREVGCSILLCAQDGLVGSTVANVSIEERYQ